MIEFVKTVFEKRQLRKRLLAFLNEMEKNLETFYVMDQRQFIIQGFALNVWEMVKDDDIVRKHEPIAVYGRTLQAFNAAHKEHKAYEQWYSSDMNNKTPDNAKKLHAMKHDLDARLKGMEAIIIYAGQALEKEMLALGFLKA